ncbi:restriction endonuclease subunit S, partial [Limosilactobacillus fermentum]|uniref:restriction endonuclease subunit S n=1 Tax=Limosilactobacillus fermentum TaxID=1613 RepID=UPI0021A2748F
DLFEEYKSKYQYPEVGDILISASGSIGRTVVYRGADEYFQDSNIVWLKHDSQLVNSFLKQFYSIVKWQGLEGSTIKRLYNKNVLEIPITLPSPEEQTKLGEFFEKLDNLITANQRKLDLLKEQKKGYLQKMFPQNGSKFPQLRFAGFADAWEQRKLGKVFDTITDYVANGSFESLRKNVNSSDINGFAYLVRLQDASNNWQGPWLYTDQHGYEFLKKSRLQPDDIIMANVGSVGKFFLVPKLDKPMTLAPNAVLIKSSENDQGFLYQMMLTPEMQHKIFEKTTPGVQSKINKTDFKMVETRLPNIEEQEKIGQFFKRLDYTIILHQRKLEKLQELKKGYLQKMFV